MSALTASLPAVGREVDRAPRVELALGRRVARQLRLATVLLTLGFGLTVASSALAYASTFTTEASRHELAAVGSDTSFAILMGPTDALETVGGYTVYKCFVFLTTIGAVWALLSATRWLRGEEDTGRWQLVVAGASTPGRATAATLGGLGAAIAVVFAGTTLLTYAAGRGDDVAFAAGPTVLYGLTLTVPMAFFAGVGAVASQVGRTRRLASAVGAVVFVVAFVLRMLADASPDLHWLRWTTPFGWSELMAPFTQNDARPLVPAALSTVALGVAAIVLAGRRDVGGGLLVGRDRAPVRDAGLRTPLGLAVRLDRGSFAGWWAGAAATALVLGMIAKLTNRSIPESMVDTLHRFGVSGRYSDQFFGVAFLLVAIVVCLLPAGQIGAAADEEASGRLVHVLTRQTSRAGWFAGRLVVAAGAVAVAGLLAGAFTWIGAASQGVDVDAWSLLAAGLNVVPTALVALGIGAVVLAVFPRLASAAVYAVVVWSMLAQILASLVPATEWLGRTSLFHYLALAPSRAIELSTIATTLGVAAALSVLATWLFTRRDLQA